MIATLVNGVGQPAVNVIPLECDRSAARGRALSVDVDELVIGITELAVVHDDVEPAHVEGVSLVAEDSRHFAGAFDIADADSQVA